MSFAEEIAAMDTELRDPAAGFGETVYLPNLGNKAVTAVVDLPVGEAESGERATDRGPQLALQHQLRPEIHMATDDAAGLREGDPIQLRGTEYLVVRFVADGAGMTRVDLMLPGAELGAAPNLRRWR